MVDDNDDEDEDVDFGKEDDDDEDDDEAESSPSSVRRDDGRNNGRGNGMNNRGRNQNQGRNNQRRFVDVSSDSSYVWRLIGMMVATFANDVGKMGFKIPAINTSLEVVQSAIGPKLTSFGINALAAAIQVPDVVKGLVRNVGLPEQINMLGDDFIDDCFEGLRMALRDNSLDEGAAHKAIQSASEKLRGKTDRLAVKSLEEAYLLLDEVEQQETRWLLAAFSPEERKTFDQYRPKLSSLPALKALLRVTQAAARAAELSGQNAAEQNAARKTESLSYLKNLYGETKPHAPVIPGIFGAIKSTIKSADSFVVDHLKPPADEPDPVVVKVRSIRYNLKMKRSL